MHILFAGGGTAGHINPALAVAGYIKERHPDAKISYIGTAEKLEAKLVPEKGYDFYTIDVAGFQRKITPKNIIKNISAVKKAVVASMDCKRFLKELKPDVVVGTGGYVSGPVLKEALQYDALPMQQIKDLLSIEETAGKVKKLSREDDESKKVKDSTSSSK